MSRTVVAGIWVAFFQERARNNRASRIHRARNAGEERVRLPDIQLRGGKVLRFEVRFGEAAVSRRMPRGVPTCMLQVNLDNVSHASSCVLLCNLRRLARGSVLRKPNLVLRLLSALCNLPI